MAHLVSNNSDKFYWHRYVDEYERVVFFPQTDVKNILEFGVLQGDSIRFLLERFKFHPVTIYGVDIIQPSPAWPVADNFKYIIQNQGHRAGVKQMFKELDKRFDIIIDDGSHEPKHQAICLIEGFPYIHSGGFYIVEDIHTSFCRDGSPTIFHLLLMIEHLKSIGRVLTPDIALPTGYFTKDEIYDLFYSIQNLHMIRRAHLPLKCWRCSKSDFDYATLRCSCGEDLYKENDSMSFVIQKK